MMTDSEIVARALYERECYRSAVTSEVLSAAAGKPVKDHMEPWEECAEVFMGDAVASIAALKGAGYHVFRPDNIEWTDINRFKAELSTGQGVYEDAGGFWVRCLKALMGIKTDPVVTYREATKALLQSVEDRAA